MRVADATTTHNGERDDRERGRDQGQGPAAVREGGPRPEGPAATPDRTGQRETPRLRPRGDRRPARSGHGVVRRGREPVRPRRAAPRRDGPGHRLRGGCGLRPRRPSGRSDRSRPGRGRDRGDGREGPDQRGGRRRRERRVPPRRGRPPAGRRRVGGPGYLQRRVQPVPRQAKGADRSVPRPQARWPVTDGRHLIPDCIEPLCFEFDSPVEPDSPFD